MQSIISVQRFFKREYGKDPPTDKTIHAWYTQFKKKTSCLCKKKSTGRPSTSPGDVERVRQLYQRSPQKSTHGASRELSMSQPTVWRVLCKRLRFKPYRLQLLQALGPADYINRAEFCIDFQNKLEDDNDNFAASATLNSAALDINQRAPDAFVGAGWMQKVGGYKTDCRLFTKLQI
ncbi:hypothetical protein C0J52_03573 [Blattella germanica]|nr:hypothetical protein C0J52_03573 [Blattella germanica]